MTEELCLYLRDFPDRYSGYLKVFFVCLFLVADRFVEAQQEQLRLFMVLSSLYELCNNLSLMILFQFVALCF